VLVKSTSDENDIDLTSSSSCVVEKLIENETNTVGVNDNKCVNNNDSKNSNINIQSETDNVYCLIAELEDRQQGENSSACNTRQNENEIIVNDDQNIKSIKEINDDDDDDDEIASSKYSDVSSRCEMLQPSTSTTALSHAALYTPTRDKNRNHRKAVRKNFSLWIGVTSCVWGVLLLLMKNYAN
jgi:hypothetical protein